MNKRRFVGIAGAAALGLALVSSGALAQQKTIKEQLVGTWTFVSAVDMAKGVKSDRWGPGGRGRAIFQADGTFMFMLARADTPKFAKNNVNEGTATENAAAMKGVIANYGTWSVDEATKTLTANIEASSFPNLNGASQKRIISSISATDLKYTNPSSSSGSVSEVVWKRAK